MTTERTKSLYKCFVDCGRMGSIEGVYTAYDDEIEFLMGREIYLYDYLGKHSEINLTVDESVANKVTSDPAVVSLFEEHKLSSGFSPVDYMDSVLDSMSDDEYEAYMSGKKEVDQ